MDDPKFPRRPPPPFRHRPLREVSPRDEITQPYSAAPSIVNPTPRPPQPDRVGTPGGAPATLPTQRPSSPEPPPGEQPRPRPPRPVPVTGAGLAGLNQGEGDRASARTYEEHLHAFIITGGVAPAAREAARAVDGPEAGELRAAEAAGKRPAKLSLLERARGAVSRLVGVIKAKRGRTP